MMRHPEPTRTREHGTPVTLAATPAERIEAIRRIVSGGGYAIVDGVALDRQTAHAILTVHDALSPPNAARLAAMRPDMAARIAWKLVH